MENANSPTPTPTDPQITAFLASFTLAGSPRAVKNKNPAIKNIITATAINIGQIRLNTLSIKAPILALVPGNAPALKAKAATGKANKTDEANKVTIFLSM